MSQTTSSMNERTQSIWVQLTPTEQRAIMNSIAHNTFAWNPVRKSIFDKIKNPHELNIVSENDKPMFPILLTEQECNMIIDAEKSKPLMFPEHESAMALLVKKIKSAKAIGAIAICANAILNGIEFMKTIGFKETPSTATPPNPGNKFQPGGIHGVERKKDKNKMYSEFVSISNCIFHDKTIGNVTTEIINKLKLMYHDALENSLPIGQWDKTEIELNKNAPKQEQPAEITSELFDEKNIHTIKNALLYYIQRLHSTRDEFDISASREMLDSISTEALNIQRIINQLNKL